MRLRLGMLAITGGRLQHMPRHEMSLEARMKFSTIIQEVEVGANACACQLGLALLPHVPHVSPAALLAAVPDEVGSCTASLCDE